MTEISYAFSGGVVSPKSRVDFLSRCMSSCTLSPEPRDSMIMFAETIFHGRTHDSSCLPFLVPRP